MKIQLDLKTLITLAGIVAMLSGFVYTTKLRFDLIDQRIEKVEDDYRRLKRSSRSKKSHSQGSKKGTK